MIPFCPWGAENLGGVKLWNVVMSGWSDGCMEVVQSREFGLNHFERKEGRNQWKYFRHDLDLTCVMNLLLLIITDAASVEITS